VASRQNCSKTCKLRMSSPPDATSQACAGGQWSHAPAPPIDVHLPSEFRLNDTEPDDNLVVTDLGIFGFSVRNGFQIDISIPHYLGLCFDVKSDQVSSSQLDTLERLHDGGLPRRGLDESHGSAIDCQWKRGG